MKTYWMLASLLSLALLLPPAAFAGPTLGADGVPKMIVRTTKLDDTTFKVTLINLLKQPTRISLEALGGDTLYRQMVRDHNGYSVEIDMSQLSGSRYILRVQCGEQIVTQVIAITDVGLLFSHITS